VPTLQFSDWPLGANLAIFAAAAAVVWAAGTRLAKYADTIAERTSLSKAFLGAVLLGVATSLPEIATTVTAALIGNAELVTGNLFGGVALQIAILAVVDAVAVRGALTHFTPQPILLFQGVMLVLLLAVSIAGAATGDPLSIGGVGLTSILLMAGYLVTVWLSQNEDYLPRWRATNPPKERDGADDASQANESREMTNARLHGSVAVAGALILVAGWALAETGDALAAQTGLGATFVGVVLVAASTSMPELSTSLGSIRQGNHQMAVSNILGTNCLEVALFFVADAAYRGGPILGATNRSALFAAAIGMVVTCIFLVGLLERRDRTVLRMGVDSLLVLIVYAIGIGGLYFLRSAARRLKRRWPSRLMAAVAVLLTGV
jgi:cation:H+ antiporter